MTAMGQRQLLLTLTECSVQLGKSSDYRQLHTLRAGLSVMLLDGAGTGIVELLQKKFGCCMRCVTVTSWGIKLKSDSSCYNYN